MISPELSQVMPVDCIADNNFGVFPALTANTPALE
jgi:hypothetical protein